MQDYQIRYLNTAKDDLAGILEFNSRFSADYQTKVKEALKSGCENLATNPEIYPAYEYNPNYRKMVVLDYVVFYRVEHASKQVSIYRILHQRQNPMK